MSREVMGSALEDVPESEHTTRTDRAVRIDERPRPDASPDQDRSAPVDRPADDEPSTRTGRFGGLGRHGRVVLERTQQQVDVVRSSRVRTAGVVAVAALVAGLVGAGVTAQLQQAGTDRASGVVAWLEYGNGYDQPGNARIAARLNVVNTSAQLVTISGVDFQGGLEEGRESGVTGELGDPLEVAPGAYASATVQAEVPDCSQGPITRGGSRDGGLRVRVSGADLRSTWVDGARVGAFPLSAGSVVEMACTAGFVRPVLVENTIVRADGDLYMTLRSGSSEDVVVGLAGPDGVTLVTEPPLPLTIEGGQAATVTVGVDLQVDTCTVSAQQLDAGNQLRLVVGEEQLPDLDYFVVNPWVVREVARACD